MKSQMTYFAGRLKERNGEQEYSYDHIIKAENLEKAEEIYDAYAKRFYDDADFETGEIEEPEKDSDGTYWFFGGAIGVEIEFISPTTKEKWMQDQFNMNLLNRKEVKNVR